MAPYVATTVIDNISDAIEAIEAKLGTGASTAAANQVLRGTGAGASAFGAIQTADLAAAALSQTGQSTLYANGLTTTATSPAAITGSDVTLTTVGGVVLVWVYYVAASSVANGVLYLGVNIDGAGPNIESLTFTPNATQQAVIVAFHRYAPAPGSHTFRATWRTGTGTLTMYTGLTMAMELKR